MTIRKFPECQFGLKLLFAIQPGIKREARRAIASPSGGMAIWVLFQAVEREEVLGWDKALGWKGGIALPRAGDVPAFDANGLVADFVALKGRRSVRLCLDADKPACKSTLPDLGPTGYQRFHDTEPTEPAP